MKRRLINTKKEKKVKKINEELLDIQTKLLQSHEKEQIEKESKIIEGIKKNSKLFFSYAKKFRKTRDYVGPLKDHSGNIVSDPKLMCEVLKTQYEKSDTW